MLVRKESGTCDICGATEVPVFGVATVDPDAKEMGKPKEWVCLPCDGRAMRMALRDGLGKPTKG